MDFVQFKLADGDAVLVIADSEDRGVSRAARVDGVIEATASSLRAALSTVAKAAGEAVKEFSQGLDNPDEITIEFGVVLNAETGAVIAKTGAAGHFKVAVIWRRP